MPITSSDGVCKVSMPWAYIHQLLGPGLHWGKSREELLHAIQQAESDGMPDAAHHLRIILQLRDTVMFDAPKEKRPADE